MPTGTKPVQATQLPRGEGQRGTHPGTTQQRHERHTRAAKSKPKYGARPPHRRTTRSNPRTAVCPSKAGGPPHYPEAAPLYHARPDPAPNKFPGRRRHWRTYNRLPLPPLPTRPSPGLGVLEAANFGAGTETMMKDIVDATEAGLMAVIGGTNTATACKVYRPKDKLYTSPLVQEPAWCNTGTPPPPPPCPRAC